jgi:site-specific DNA-methyltransferase (adenine-specific)
MEALHSFLKHSPMMAYLAMMAPRLLELHRILKETGSLYLHCDPTASHYLRMLLDEIFGAPNFRNEIIWKRTSAHANVLEKFGAVHDCILFYSVSGDSKWNQQYAQYTKEYIETFFDQVDENGKRYFRRDLTALTSARLWRTHPCDGLPSILYLEHAFSARVRRLLCQRQLLLQNLRRHL